MTRWSALLAALAAAASTVAWAPSAAAAACSGTTGVSVVVDFGSLGGGARVSCAPGDPSSGLGALSGAGFGYAGVSSHPGMVCKINDLPAAEQCRRPPPTTAYWSYWHASRGGSWVYSTTGAGYRDPAPGTVDGWAFGAGAPPSVPPPAPRAAPEPPPPAPRPTETAEPTRPGERPPPAPAPGRGTTTTRPTSTTPAAGTTTMTTSTPGTTTAPTGTATTTAAAATTDDVPVVADVQPSAGQPAEDAGGPVPFLIGAGAVLLVGGLAVGAARRRAKADP